MFDGICSKVTQVIYSSQSTSLASNWQLPYINSSRGRMALEIISWPIPMKECCRTAGSNPRTSAYQAISRGTFDPAELARPHFIKKEQQWPSKFLILSWSKSTNKDFPHTGPPLKISLFPLTPPYQKEKGRSLVKILFLSQRRLINSKIWERAAAWQNQQNDLCAQWKLKSGWASAPSDQSLRCPHEETLGP